MKKVLIVANTARYPGQYRLTLFAILDSEDEALMWLYNHPEWNFGYDEDEEEDYIFTFWNDEKQLNREYLSRYIRVFDDEPTIIGCLG